MTRPFSPGEVSRHTAAVHRSEAQARRLTQPEFSAWLYERAAAADRRAEAAESAAQPDLFGSEA